MSQEELLDAFIAGRIGRRAFVRGLTALGIAQSSAVLHAAALRPDSTALADDLYHNHHHNDHDDHSDHDDHNDRHRHVGGGGGTLETGSEIAASGDGGVANAQANGGAISLGDINSGGNVGNAISVGNTVRAPSAAPAKPEAPAKAGKVVALPATGVGEFGMDLSRALGTMAAAAAAAAGGLKIRRRAQYDNGASDRNERDGVSIDGVAPRLGDAAANETSAGGKRAG